MRKLPDRMQNKLYKDHFLPDETKKIRKKIRNFAEKEIFPIAYEFGQKRESNDNFPFDIFQKMANEGFFKIPHSKTDSGLGLEYPACASAVMAEELAYISNSMAGLINAHFLLAGITLSHGNADIKRRFLEKVIDGSAVASFAMTEP
ncbi:MAG: acyl-CoA dehydrogenase, partial [Candidatus Dadabacteria bacterium]|nr:acyl-CoA dehydrogenase [Candidatus Dadabacteria bacterium]NIQ14692.1 acyl-CoA dehydrogenase [Candidatus Dadabacteria bacterium]